MLGICSLPTELLQSILLDVYPNDLITLASSNRHLRRSVPVCVDFAFAKRHVAAVNNHRKGFSVWKLDYLDPEEDDILPVFYDHPLLFKHTVAEFAVSGIYRRVAMNLWGKNWRPTPTDGEREQAIWLRRIDAMCESIERREWLVLDSEDGELDDDEFERIDIAAEMAGHIRSMKLLDALRNAFPDDISYDPECNTFRIFLFASAKAGFCDGLALIPSHHDIFKAFDTEYRASLFGEVERASLLKLACQSGHVPAVELLIQKGALVNLPPSDDPILFSAIADDKVPVLRLLLQHGINVDSRCHRETALHRAAREGCPEVMKLLLEFGADVEAPDRARKTPLCFAAQYGGPECVRLLLDAGAKVDVTDEDGMTPLALCSDKEILVTRWSRAKDPDRKCVEVVKMLLEAGSRVDTVDEGGCTPLHRALERGSMVKARLLLDAGAAATQGCREGSTALAMWQRHLVWSRECQEVLDRLVEGGADLWGVGCDGMSAWEKLREAGKQSPEWWRWMARHGELDEETRQALDALSESVVEGKP
ncbi:hypothetical protein HDU96_007756 [Phlyctochytrium bullatum]|nr:hypothetical protein HDU96_007756 [Phlyctochytrium bullatum]